MRGMEFELEQLLHPASIFDHPRDVLNDPDLTKQETRAILSSGASDASADEDAPALRRPPGMKPPVTFAELEVALRNLAHDPPPRPGPFPTPTSRAWRLTVVE